LERAMHLILNPNHADTSEEIQRIVNNVLPPGSTIHQLKLPQQLAAVATLCENLERAKEEAQRKKTEEKKEIQRIARQALPEGAHIDELSEQQKRKAQETLVIHLNTAIEEALSQKAEEFVRRAEERTNAQVAASA
jgi:hypothetical protein